jgi:hypothetical protein
MGSTITSVSRLRRLELTSEFCVCPLQGKSIWNMEPTCVFFAHNIILKVDLRVPKTFQTLQGKKNYYLIG